MVGLMKKSKTPKAKTQKATTQTGPKKSKKSKTGSMPKSTPSKSEKSSSPKKRNLKKLILYGIPILLILALVAALIVVLLLGKFGGSNVCETKECIMLADHLHNWKDDSVDPCQDFFKYSCGKYYEHNVAEDQMTKKTIILSGLIKEFLKKNKPTSSKTEQLMAHLYKKCEETKYGNLKDQIEKDMLEDIKQEALNIGWPLADSTWDDNSFDLADLLDKIKSIIDQERFEISYGIFKFKIPAAPKVLIDVTSEYFSNSEDVKKTLLLVLGSAAPSKLDDRVKEIIDFSQALYDIDVSTPQSNNLDEIMSSNYQELNAALPVFNYLILSLLSKGSRNWGKVKNQVYGVNSFLSKARRISDLVYKDKKITANYLVYKYISNSLRFRPATNARCDQIVAYFLPLPSLRVFIRNHFDKGGLKDVDNLVEDIRASFIEMLEKSEWIHEKTRSGAIRKAKAMKKTISYPGELEKPGALDKHFNIKISPFDSYYLTMRKIDLASMKLMMDYVSSDFPMGPHFSLMTNAAYAIFGNSINVFAPIMDDPLFHTSFPNYAKIAGIGFIIGHEIGHGYDETGINFDKNGNLKPWIDDADRPEYQKKQACLINQYENYDDPSFGKKLNGTITQEEMVADEIGQDVAWRTFKKLDLSQEKRIIGFEDYSIEKLYFQIGATNWCAPRSSLPLARQLNDKHATNSFRVNGLFANEKAFAEAFNCPVGSPMNPVKKCTMF